MVGDRSRNSSFTVGADAIPKPRSLKFSIPDTYQATQGTTTAPARAAPLIEAARYAGLVRFSRPAAHRRMAD